ncbi:pheromone A receptor-domain-containing protein [Lasiosphaeria hispida]|uniref:Pheromone A receptor-domain-containing protein n=1 Tax=Lasiosphaeria hispida TaxID=260671 RepID=A0AAJ0MG77_9PEZI|nr:pheromone A receptor-domain-containing protein [Lasiosphaeria hispida]
MAYSIDALALLKGTAYLLLQPSLFGFTTTPEQRIGPGAPYTNPALQANLFFRVVLGFLAIIVSCVPAKLLWRNGEFAATVFCVTAIIRNLNYAINALIWRDNNVATWYAGYGWCDLQIYINFPMDTAFNICLFEIMRGLATKVGLQRVTSLTSGERRRQQLISALVIFTVPLVQVILTFFLKVRRYNVSTLVGCTILYDPDWIFYTFFILMTPLFIVAAAVMAGVVFRRFRQIERLTREVVHSHDSVLMARQQRVRRKLYFMTLGILVFVLPVIVAMFIWNTARGAPWASSYSYNLTHFGPDPFNMYFISFTTSDLMGFGDLAVNYIPALTAIVIFFVFGTTTEALNDYRRLLLLFGMGCVFPKLHEEILPNRNTMTSRLVITLFAPIRPDMLTPASRESSNKNSVLPTVEHMSHTSHSELSPHQSCVSSPTGTARTADNNNPWPDLSAEGEFDSRNASSRHHGKNQWSPWAALSLSPLQRPPMSFSLPSFGIKKGARKEQPDSDTMTHHNPSLPQAPPPCQTAAGEKSHAQEPVASDLPPWSGASSDAARVDTRVWSSDDEVCTMTPGTEGAAEVPKREWMFGSHGRRERGRSETGREKGVRVETETQIASLTQSFGVVGGGEG